MLYCFLYSRTIHICRPGHHVHSRFKRRTPRLTSCWWTCRKVTRIASSTNLVSVMWYLRSCRSRDPLALLRSMRLYRHHRPCHDLGPTGGAKVAVCKHAMQKYQHMVYKVWKVASLCECLWTYVAWIYVISLSNFQFGGASSNLGNNNHAWLNGNGSMQLKLVIQYLIFLHANISQYQSNHI